jgi:molybdopterin/thiamine biosynthesis adenylyltransferase
MDTRYSRQILFQPIGWAGQEKLINSRVLLVGCGALGASHAEMLARAGVGKLRLVDRDFVEFSNLQRQTLYQEKDAIERLPKAIAAKKRIAAINSDVRTEAIVTDVNPSNIEELVENCDLILDGTDNFQVRYLVNDACVKLKKTWIYGAAVASYGTTMTIIPNRTPCLRCIFEEIPDAGSSPTCDTAGVIMPIISTISAVQVTEALKILTGNVDQLHRSLLQFDVWQTDWRKIKLREPLADCICCGERRFEFLESQVREFFTALCGRDAVQISAPKPTKLDLPALAEKLKNLGEIKQNEYLVRFQADGFEVTVFQDARAIIKGTDDLTTARSVYAKYIGV